MCWVKDISLKFEVYCKIFLLMRSNTETGKINFTLMNYNLNNGFKLVIFNAHAHKSSLMESVCCRIQICIN
jgi:hypothetical protein